MNEVLKARITDAYLGIVDINGFKFNKHRMEVQKVSIECLIPINEDVYPGDCIQSEKWVITCLDPKHRPVEVLVRIDEFEHHYEEDFQISEYLNTRVVGLFCISSKCVLKSVGVDRTPFFNATLKVKNSFDQSYELYILGFQKQAKQMSTIKGGSVVECVVTVKRRLNEPGWEFPVAAISVKSEGDKQ